MRDLCSSQLLLSFLLMSGSLVTATGCGDEPSTGQSPSPSDTQTPVNETPTNTVTAAGPTSTPTQSSPAGTATASTVQTPDTTNSATAAQTHTPSGPTATPTNNSTVAIGTQTAGPTPSGQTPTTVNETGTPGEHTSTPTQPSQSETTQSLTPGEGTSPTPGEATSTGETPTPDHSTQSFTNTPTGEENTQTHDGTGVETNVTASETATFAGETATPTASATQSLITPTASATPPLITPIPVRTPEAGDLIISEVQHQPRLVDDSEGEWLEIYNASAAILDISDVRVQVLYDDDDKFFTLSKADSENDYNLVPGESAIISHTADRDDNGQIRVDYLIDGRLGLYTSGWGLALYNGSNEIDAMPFDPETWPNIEGHSLILSSDAAGILDAGKDVSNWCPSFVEIAGSTDLGSPGQRNALCLDDLDLDNYPSDQDCDDDNFDVNPSMGEVPANSIDDDCDSQIDEEPQFSEGQVVLSEIMANPRVVGDNNGEWLELYNTGDTPVNLEGWSISDTAQSHIINDTLFLLGNSYVVLGNNPDPLSNGGYVPDYVVPGITWNNDVETVTVSNDNLLIDSVSYDSSWRTDDGQSFSLDPDHLNDLENDTDTYWCLATTEIAPGQDSDKGSPGSQNPDCPLDMDNDGYDENEECDDNDPAINPAAFDLPDDGIDQDCNGWDPTESQVLVITEVMYASGDDPDSEWIELWNPSIYTINLNGWILEDNITGNRHTVAQDLFIDSDEHVLVGSDIEGRFQVDIQYAYGNALRLSNTSDVVSLYNPLDTLIDQITYSNGDPWPDADGKVSIQLSQESYGQDNNTPALWCASESIHNANVTGTPGTRNITCP